MVSGMTRRGWLGATISVLLLAGALSACGTAVGGSRDAGSITLYNAQHEQTTQALVDAFEHQSGIHVNVRSGDEAQLTQQIEVEGSKTPADVIFTENSPALMSLQGKGLLAPAPASVLSQVPPRYSSPQGDWVGVSARVSVMVYNTNALSAAQLPTSVLDLASPQWKGKLALAPTETDFLPVVQSVAVSKGQQAALDWLKGVKANAASHMESDNETVTADVNSGQAPLGLIDHYYWYRLNQQKGGSGMHSKIAFFAAGDPGYVVDVSGAGVLKASKHQAEANQFLAFLVSSPGQGVIVDSDSFEYPLRPGVAAPSGLVPFDQLQPAPVTVADLGDGSEALRLMQQVQLV
jgi:iron(III) transport system substrate-binding protein